jgi:hypothetical protein
MAGRRSDQPLPGDHDPGLAGDGEIGTVEHD